MDQAFSWTENACQTDADMIMVISGIGRSHLEERVDVSAINTQIVKEVVLTKAYQFIDVCVIEELVWNIGETFDECGDAMKEICVNARIHLAKPGIPFDGVYDDDDESTIEADAIVNGLHNECK